MRGLVGRLLTAALLVVTIVPSTAFGIMARVGPPANEPTTGGYPKWYQDTTGLALEFCDPKNQAEVDGGWCLLLPADVPFPPELFPSEFAAEHFWYAADASIDTFTGKKAILVLAVEAAFPTETAAAGAELSFARIRVRLEDSDNGLPPGQYRFIHPYGVEIENLALEADGTQARRIFLTDDVGIGVQGDFSGALLSRLGPFLLPSNTPGGAELPPVAGPSGLYIADPGRVGPVTGSPTGFNGYRIEGPPGSNLDGQGNDFIETFNFSLVGRIYQGPMPGRLTLERANYTSNTAGKKIDVYAKGLPTVPGRLPGQPTPAAVQPTLTYFGAPCTGTAPSFGPPAVTEQPMTRAGVDYFGQNSTGAIPASICVKDHATDLLGNATPQYMPLTVTDQITITKAFFNKTANSLTVNAFSSDSSAPPVLTLEGFGALANGAITGVTVAPPSMARVTSSKGGVTDYFVSTNNTAAPVATTLTLTPDEPSPHNAGTAVTFVARAPGTVAPEFAFTLLQGTTTIASQPYGTGDTFVMPANQAVGNYQVQARVRTNPAAPPDLTTTIPYTVQLAPATAVSLTASAASPQIQGTAVTFTANATGSSGYQYKFWLKDNNVVGSAFVQMQDYSATNFWTLPATQLPSSYTVLVYARSGTTAPAQATNQMNFVISPKATGVSVTALPSTGNPILLTAAGAGSSNYQYKFWIQNLDVPGSVYVVGRDYSASDTWVMTPSVAIPAGRYSVLVYVRTTAAGAQEASTTTTVTLTP
jgi:hypothetical protein